MIILTVSRIRHAYGVIEPFCLFVVICKRRRQMHTRIALAALLAALTMGLFSPAQAEVNQDQESSVSFTERWAPVEEALRSGNFAVKDSHGRY